MTKEQQRIAIAEWYGFENIKEETTGLWGWIDVMTAERLNWQASYYQESHDLAYCKVPNFPDDLNAMHEAEMRLEDLQYAKFCLELQAVVVGVRKTEPEKDYLGSMLPSSKLAIRSEAYQRSEALCQTLWPEKFTA